MSPAYSLTHPVGQLSELGEFVMQRIHLRNEAKTATLEKLVGHLGTLEATRAQLHETRELARKTEHDLRDRIAELSGSSKGNPYS
jgi:predicted nuclease with TOPRIM domain